MHATSLRELECFHAVAEELNFTAAARRLHLSQPPLSRHIATLEDKLGARLFLRTRRQVQLTAAGRLFREETRGLLAQLAKAEAAVRERGWHEAERLAVGFVSALLSAELVEDFARFHEVAPEVHLTLHDESPVAQLERLKAGTLDLGFIGLAPLRRDRAIALWPWRRERLGVFVPRRHRLAGKTSIPVGELAGESLALVSHETAPAFGSRVRELLAAAGILPQVVQEGARAQAVAMMALGGTAVALLPESVGLPLGYRPASLLDAGGEVVWLEFVVATPGPPCGAGKRFLETLAARG
ncbi:MAG: LysR substrate-binding domain-containing protein [Verrucomicrobiota bacterium]